MAAQDSATPTAPAARAKTEVPPFTVGTLRKAIPPHCFKRSAVKSFGYLGVNVLVAVVLFCTALQLERANLGAASWALWPVYWFLQGAVCTGIWVIAHECGHGAFSEQTWVNDLVGLVFHSLLLVPYYSWKHSHRRHHSNTGNMGKDEVFVPQRQPDPTRKYSLPRAMFLLGQQVFGWPLYLFFNATGRPYDRWANHFDPYSPIFSKRERIEVLVSDIALAIVCLGLWRIKVAVGLVWLLKFYVAPLLVVNHWLVMITFLQHTHPELPHYEDSEWDWLRGALATVDRSYGVLDHVFHHIADTHVTHHLFSQIPHYHAQEATEAIKPILGDYYKTDSRNVLLALWQEMTNCQYVAPDQPGSGILWFKTNAHKAAHAIKQA